MKKHPDYVREQIEEAMTKLNLLNKKRASGEEGSKTALADSSVADSSEYVRAIADILRYNQALTEIKAIINRERKGLK